MKKGENYGSAQKPTISKAEARTTSAGIFLTMPPESSMITPKNSIPSKRGMTSEGVGRNRYTSTHAATSLYS